MLKEDKGEVRYAEIDVALVPLIATMWRCGIPTCHSCQGRKYKGHPAYICFWEWADAQRFVAAVGKERLSLEPDLKMSAPKSRGSGTSG